MTPTADNIQILEETVLCEIADIKRSRRQTWARDDLLRKASAGGKYGERDAIETAALAQLVRILGYEDAVIAWRSVKPRVATIRAGTQVDVVYDLIAKEAVIATEDAQVADFARRENAMRLVRLGEVIADVRAAFRRVRDTKRARERARERATSAGPTRRT
jgi:hypothetical protein